ncbi:hypothetical protein PG995_007514 [Apiospora arundinis]
MVTPACYNTSSETSRRYSRGCPPYPLGYLDNRRYPHHHHLPSSHHETTRFSKTMVERDTDDAPRKRIAVACGRCRKRKIRCSGDPGNGGPCSNCKNAGHEPCLFLRVSSTETHLRDGSGDYGYNVETARAYHARSSAGGLSPLSSYGAVMGAEAYRQSSYPSYGAAGSKGGYYSAWTGAGGYPDDGGVSAAADYGLGGYPAYPTHMGQGDPVEALYRYNTSTSSSKAAAAAAGSVYVDPAEAAAASTYPYGSLVHRPAGGAATAAAVAAAVSSSELPNFSLSSMAASLPSSQNSNGSTVSERLPNPHRTLSSSSSVSAYRTADGLPPASESPYASKATPAVTGTADVGAYSDFESPASYSTGTSSSATLSGRLASGHYSSAATADYGADSYIHTDSSTPRRDSQAGGPLANGHDYVPVSHDQHTQASLLDHPGYTGGGSTSGGNSHHAYHNEHRATSYHEYKRRAAMQQQHHHQDEHGLGTEEAAATGGATSDRRGGNGRHHLRGH